MHQPIKPLAPPLTSAAHTHTYNSYCLTHSERVSLWNLATADRVAEYNTILADCQKAGVRCHPPPTQVSHRFYTQRHNACPPSPSPSIPQVDAEYLVECHYQEKTQQLSLLAGSRSGGMHLLSLAKESVQFIGSLPEAHRQQVRCAHWMQGSAASVNSTMISGGEDGLLCKWQPGGAKAASHKPHAAGLGLAAASLPAEAAGGAGGGAGAGAVAAAPVLNPALLSASSTAHSGGSHSNSSSKSSRKAKKKGKHKALYSPY